MLFSGLIIIILWLCQVVFLDDIYKTIKINEIKYAARTITEHIDSDELEVKAEKIAYDGEICILALRMMDNDTAEKVLLIHTSSECTIHNTDEHSKFVLYDSAVASGGELLQRFRFDEKRRAYYSIDDDFYRSNTSDPESIIYTNIIINKDGDSILLMLDSVISPVSATVRTLNYLLAAITVLLFFLTLGLAFIMTQQVSKPIIKINESAKRLAQRKYDTVFTEQGYREIAELGKTLNYAALELSKVDDLYRELIANISHDLRTPLTMITGYSEVIRDLPGENTPENIQIIIDEANRLTSLVNDVLDISRLRNGLQQFENIPFNLTEAIENTLTRYSRLVENDGYTIDFIYENDVIVNTDRSRILQVLYNLVNNAITYTGADKKVTVRQLTRKDTVCIEITDTGEGIEADQLEFIWDRYYKLDKIHRRAAVGTGLGLSIVKTVMEAAGGRCGVSSKVGSGSTFWFELKIYNDTAIGDSK
ncbi:MAG: HAMP domain-containing sensor histidine kinase [Eubacteriales bacterium]|nr:HAMP domain-containing sensor histidine kinase [Eubacteriales bacterium]